MVKSLVNQVYILSIISLILSIVFGLGIIFAIASLSMCQLLKKNYYVVNQVKLDQSIFYCIASIILSLIFIALEYSIISMY